jgi:outer membrane immunogenic protein
MGLIMSARKSLALAIAVAGIGGAAHSVPASAGPGTWAGPYLGIGGGGGWADQSQHGGVLTLPGGGTSVSSVPFSSGSSDGDYHLSGGLLGGAVGYNFQSDRTIYGIEADASWADITGSGTCGTGGVPLHACGGAIWGLETLRGRLGYDLGWTASPFTDVMAFISGGLAVGQIHAWDAYLSTSGTKTVAGWTIGGGLEAMLGRNWSVKLEYLHIDFGDPAIFTALPPNPEHVSTTADVVRVGLDYHFNTPPPSGAPMLRK